MHLVNCSVAPAQLLPQLLLVWAACACVAGAGSAALLEPPHRLLMPLPTTWPIEEPIATPLCYAPKTDVSHLAFTSPGLGWLVRGGAGHLAEETGALGDGGGRSLGGHRCRGSAGSRGSGVGGCRAGLLLLGRGGRRAGGDRGPAGSRAGR